MVDDEPLANPIEKLVDAIVLTSHERAARFVAIEEGRLRRWVGDGWDEDEALPALVFEPIVKRLCVMMGVLAPGAFAREDATTVVGKLRFSGGDRRVCVLVRIERARDPLDPRAERRLRALLELVDEAEHARRGEPRLPSEHPYRGR